MMTVNCVDIGRTMKRGRTMGRDRDVDGMGVQHPGMTAAVGEPSEAAEFALFPRSPG